VDAPGGGRELLYGASVFARSSGVEPTEVLGRFRAAPTYVETTVGVLRAVGFAVISTGQSVDHVDAGADQRRHRGRRPGDARRCSRRGPSAVGELRPNPSYAGGADPSEET